MRQQPAKASTYFWNNYSLYLTVQTWEKDSHGLYDYEATKLLKETYEIQGPCKLFRNWLTSQTSAVSNDKIRRGNYPEDSFSFHATVALKHNGNFERTNNLNAEFMLSPPEKPSQDIYRKENSDETGPLNTNTYIVVRFFKGDKRVPGYPMSIKFVYKECGNSKQIQLE